jgi:hypothetical protein
MSQGKGDLILEIPEHFTLIQNYDKSKVNVYDEKFVESVKKECELIREFFTEEEIDRLIADHVDGQSPTQCIYGTMVGHCNHPRVADFILNKLDTLLVANKPVDQIKLIGLDVYDRSFESIYTPLEHYISPTDEEEKEAWFDEDIENDIFPDSYYERIRDVVKWIKNEY